MEGVANDLVLGYNSPSSKIFQKTVGLMPKDPKTKRRRFIDRLVRHYRLVLVNDDNLKTEASLKLNLLNVILLGSSLFVVFAAIIIALIVLTPARELIPGYENTYEHRQRLVEYKQVTDSILRQMSTEETYYGNLIAVLKDSVPTTVTTHQPLDPGATPRLTAPGHDSVLRAEMEQVEGYGILEGREIRTTHFLEEVHFFCPLRGPVMEPFEPSKSHYGIDIVAAEKSAIKAALDGKVIQAGWSSTDGYFVVIQHANNLSSIYKHNASLMARTGDHVRAGDVVAIIGNTGEFSRGVHLHFELWYNMTPVDPMLYITFS